MDLHKGTFPSMPESVEKMLLPSGYYHNLPTDPSEQKNNPSAAMNSSEQVYKNKTVKILL